MAQTGRPERSARGDRWRLPRWPGREAIEYVVTKPSGHPYSCRGLDRGDERAEVTCFLEAVGNSSSTTGCLPCTVRVRLGGAVGDIWTAPEDHPRSYGNPVGELATYREYLGRYRLTIEMKCEGLDADRLARPSVPPRTLSLVGLFRHLAADGGPLVPASAAAASRSATALQTRGRPGLGLLGRDLRSAVVKDAFATWKAKMAEADEWLDALNEADL